MILPPVFKHCARTVWRILRFFILLFSALFLLGGSVVPPMGLSSLVRAQTRPIEFAFDTWTLDAIASKLSNWGLSLHRFISPQDQCQWVLTYLDQVQSVRALNLELLLIYADPTVENPEETSLIRIRLDGTGFTALVVSNQ